MTRTEETHQTKPTGRNDSATPVGPELIAVLTCNQPSAGSSRHSLRGVTRVEIGRSTERRVRREGATLRLGLPDVRLSSNHARLELVDGNWWFEDLGSTNGSSINGGKASRCLVSDGDLLELGYSFFYFLEAVAAGGRPNDHSQRHREAPARPCRGGLRLRLRRLGLELLLARGKPALELSDACVVFHGLPLHSAAV